ncbi:hypothetical protein [Mycetocola spongiae]|uniref:hypothetical protein n=1 Tax=Mycetocola spongiae TaxID=2859226 RepID=UPI001CF54445|nr:hypothetical protein [Mycetocola spongiae]UCR88521.1 hypothetical protein KXZ72_11205 [Mycetocola spongiae]
MSTNETGGQRLPKKVYARRRLTVLLVLVAVVAVIALLIWQPGSRSDKPNAKTDPLPVTSSATASPGAEAKNAEPACDPSAVVVSAITDKSSYAAGENPKLKLSITNTGNADCSLNVGTSKQVFTISSGSETYWRSTDCQTQPSDQTSVLKSGETVESSAALDWDRTRSDVKTCEEERAPVPTGGASYHLVVSLDGIKSTNTKQFVLE